jgi:hypothetical protein
MRHHQFMTGAISILTAAGVAAIATSASAWESPLERRYLTKPLQVCDQGIFYVGGAPKVTPFGAGPTSGANTQIIIGSMYVEFQVPMKSKTWPLIMVHGSGYTGSCVRGTAGGTEGWMDYTVRHGVPTFVVDQAGRARSGFDKSVIHEGEALIDSDPAAAKELIPTLGGSTSTAWTSWFGHIVPTEPPPVGDVTIGQMIRHGAAGDPLCATEPAHCNQLGRIPMEPEAPWAVDQAIASRTGNGAPAGLGTVVPDTGGHVNAAFPLNDRFLALDAYKFNVPNTESTLPSGTCPGCTVDPLAPPPAPGMMPVDPTVLPPTSVWTPKALAELVEGLGGAVVATHSQSGIMGHHMVRILKERGKLHLLKGLITIEGSCSLANSGLTAADFKDIPYLAFKGDYREGPATLPGSAMCQASVDAINAAGGTADYIQLDQPGPWQGSYTGPFGPDYVGPFAGVSHMMMIESNPAPNGKATNLQVMDVILDWTGENIKNPKETSCKDGDDGDHKGRDDRKHADDDKRGHDGKHADDNKRRHDSKHAER